MTSSDRTGRCVYSLPARSIRRRLLIRSATAGLVTALLYACAPQPTRPVEQPTPQPTPAPSIETEAPQTRVERGRVSLYGKEFAGRPTASGAPFDPEALTMAHRSLPFGTRVRVTNLENRRSVEVVVNDRGPFIAGRIADLSLAAARALGMIADGVVDAIIEVVAPAAR